jgi:hypothetical protein
MATRLPHGALATVEIRKLVDYCLDPSHPRGHHKARVFQEVLGLTCDDAIWLRDAMLAAAKSADAVLLTTGVWGDQWRVDVQMTRQRRTVVVRSTWIIRTGEFRPRFVSCWVLK